MTMTMPNVGLAKASDRAVNRLYSTAIANVARENGKDRLAVEDAVSEARGAITDMYRNEFYFGWIQRKIAELSDLHGKLIRAGQEAKPPITDPLTRKIRSPEFINKTTGLLHEMIDGAWEHLGKRNVSREGVKLFIDVIEETERLYLREKFDPTSIIDAGVITLARAVYADFDGYSETINMRL